MQHVRMYLELVIFCWRLSSTNTCNINGSIPGVWKTSLKFLFKCEVSKRSLKHARPTVALLSLGGTVVDFKVEHTFLRLFWRTLKAFGRCQVSWSNDSGASVVNAVLFEGFILIVLLLADKMDLERLLGLLLVGEAMGGNDNMNYYECVLFGFSGFRGFTSYQVVLQFKRWIKLVHIVQGFQGLCPLKYGFSTETLFIDEH